MSLKIKLRKIDKDFNPITTFYPENYEDITDLNDLRLYNNIIIDLFDIYAEFVNDTTAPFPNINLYENEYIWTIRNTHGTNSSIVAQFTGEHPNPFVFYHEGINTIELRLIQYLLDDNTQTQLEYTTTLTLNLYEIGDIIYGPEYVKLNSTDVSYYVKDGAEKYIWNTGSNTNETTLDFLDLKTDTITCTITHGQQSKTLSLDVKTVIGPIVENDYIKTDVSDNLMFFNNKGDYLNFDYNEYEPGLYRWEGNLLFEENSNDTFKTINLYTLEKVEPITMTNLDELEASTSGDSSLMYNKLNLIKYQLFNEFGIDFHRKRESELEILDISYSIKSNDFYSKWVYGNNFHMKFRVGSEVWFEGVKFTNGSPIDFESKDNQLTPSYWKTFTVIDSKNDAILVLTDTPNDNWTYEYDKENKGKIYSANFIRVWDPAFIDKEWNEYEFNQLRLNGLYDKKKLTVVNSDLNSGVYTVNLQLIDDKPDKPIPYKEKYIKSVKLNRKDLEPGHGFQITLDFLANRILLSTSVVDFIPSSLMSMYLNRKNLILWDWTINKDLTPNLLQPDVSFTFEQDGQNVNFNYIYTVIKKDKALNILEPNDSDRKGYTIETISVIDCLIDPPTIRIKNYDSKSNEDKMFDIKLTDNETFNDYIKEYIDTGSTTLLPEYLTNIIQTEINKQAKGIKTYWEIDSTEVIIVETLGWKLSDVQIISTQNKNGVISTINNPTNGELPTTGIIGATETDLNENTLGYIYYRTNTNTFHIQVDYDIENQQPIWYTIHELQTVVWVDSTGIVEYQQNVSQPAYLTSTEITFKQEWINAELLTSIELIDLDQLEQINPDAEIFKQIATEQYAMFNNFIANWQSTFEHYGVDLYIQTDANIWDYDVTYQNGEYTKFGGIFYKSLVSDNSGKQPDENIDTYWKKLDELILLCTEQKYLLNSTDSNLPQEKDDYMSIIFNSINTFLNDDNATSGYILPLNTTTLYSQVYQIEVLETVNDEYNRVFGKHINLDTKSIRQKRRIIINDIDQVYGLNVIINGIEFPVNFDNISTGYDPELNNAYDIQETLFDWGNRLFGVDQDTFSPDDHTDIGLKYYQKLESLGIIVYLERSGQYDNYFGTAGFAPYDTIVMLSKYPNVNFTFELRGTNNRHLIYHSEILFYTIGNILTISVNGVPMSVNTANIESTLKDWIEIWSPELEMSNIFVKYKYEDGVDKLVFYTLYDTTKLKYTVWVGITPTPARILYNIINLRPGNEGLIIAGNEVLNLIPYSDFQKYNFATGMIVSVKGSKWPLNNQEYNILLVDPRNLGLSYQGPFWNSFDKFGEGFDDIDVDPDRPGNQNFDWEQYADKFVNFDVTDYLKMDRVDDIGNDASFYQIEFTDVTVVDISEILYWEWRYGDDSDKEIVLNSGTNGISCNEGTSGASTSGTPYCDNNKIVHHVYKSTGTYIVTMSIKFTNGSYQSVSSVYTITEDTIFERGPQIFDDISLQTREFLRYPREGYDYEPRTFLNWRLEEIYDDLPASTNMFLYDVTGSQLSDTGIYAYTGPKPLFANNDIIYLNDKPNTDLDHVNIPKYQQTIFKNLTFELYRIDSEIDVTYETEPMQTLVAYKNDQEEVNQKYLVLEKYNPLNITIKTEKIESNNTIKDLPITDYKNVVYFISDLNEIRVERFDTTFIDLGLKIGMKLVIKGYDNTSLSGQVTFINSGKVVRVKNFGTNWIKLTDDSEITDEISWKTSKEIIAPYKNISVSFTIELNTVPVEIGRFNLLGQTEIEDDRYRIMMYNLGLNIQPRHTFIFKEYNIKEAGIDWTYLNTKRKELLANFPEIYNYIGAYKAVINSINYFGYNDLDFNEYYRNVDENSERFGKLEKVKIHDIFNNLVEGFTFDDEIIKYMPSKRYIKTNLFNLTYQITDNNGNNILAYSLNEVITKLLGLKQWLNEEAIPIGRRIIDITGNTVNSKSFNYSHDQKNVINIRVNQEISPVDFKIEAYLQPVFNDSSTYNIHLDFFTQNDAEIRYFSLTIMTFSDENYAVDTSFEMHAVQIIKEIRTTMESYNFAADVNVDPYILVEVTTDNGYGIIYKHKQTYSLKIFDFIV